MFPFKPAHTVDYKQLIGKTISDEETTGYFADIYASLNVVIIHIVGSTHSDQQDTDSGYESTDTSSERKAPSSSSSETSTHTQVDSDKTSPKLHLQRLAELNLTITDLREQLDDKTVLLAHERAKSARIATLGHEDCEWKLNRLKLERVDLVRDMIQLFISGQWDPEVRKLGMRRLWQYESGVVVKREERARMEQKKVMRRQLDVLELLAVEMDVNIVGSSPVGGFSFISLDI